jgi:osmotically-inducible protein OsmY
MRLLRELSMAPNRRQESAESPLVTSGCDQRIEDAIQAALAASGYPAIGALKCEVVEGTIVLSGTVSSFYLKQLAQSVVLRLEAAQFLHNRVEVRRIADSI